VIDVRSLEQTVGAILGEVRSGGDTAVRKFSLQFDKVAPESLELRPWEMEVELDEELKAAVRTAKENIEKFHRSQLKEEPVIETMPGVKCWRRAVAIEKVGLYIPGGTAPLFSTLLMLAIPARIAGCREIILCSPPDAEGRLHPALLYAAGLIGGIRIFRGYRSADYERDALGGAAGFEFLHVPYQGRAAIQDLLKGEIASAIMPIGSSLGLVQSGWCRKQDRRAHC